MSSRFLQQLRREQRIDSASQAQQLYYLLDSGASHLRLRLVVARPQPNGRLEGMQPYQLQTRHLQQPPPFLEKRDIELLEMLGQYDAGWLQRSEGELPGAAAMPWLEAMLATGRARTSDGRMVKPGGTLQLDCRWEMDAAGRQKLDWQRPPGIRILRTTPNCYWDELHGEIGLLGSDLPAEALVWLERRPRLAPAEVPAFIDEHGEDFSNWGLPLPQVIETREIAPAPQPQLRLYRGTREQGPGGDRLRLGFVYDCEGEAVAFDHADKQPSHELYHNGTLLTVYRNHAEETALERKLYTALADYEPQPLAGAEFTFADRHAWFAVMTELIPALKQQGWRIVAEPGFRHHFVRAERVQLAAHWLERDWLELALHVEIDGETVPLLPALVECAKRYTREQLQNLPDDTELPLSLADGRRLLLPVSRLRHWLSVLVELDSESPEAETLQLPQSQLHRLNTLDDGEFNTDADADALLARARNLQAPPSLNTFELPESFNAELRGYQRLGAAWLQQRRELGAGGILADDMGLGKTVQTLAHLAVEQAAGRLQAPALVVAPTSVLHNWQQEAARFAPGLRCAVLHGPQRHRLWKTLQDHDLLLTSYALIVKDSEQWRQQALSTVILDEAQAIKNARSKTAQHVRKLEAPYKVCLTGTPLENHLGELWSLFEFLMPGFLDSEERFNRQYRKPIENEGDQARAQSLMQRVAPFILRRRKEDVAADLPPKTEMLVRLPLPDTQRDLYETLRQRSAAQLQQRLTESDDNQGRVLILNALMQLRQACCDPRLIEDAPGYREADSAKREHLLEMLEELVDEGRAVLVFSQFTRMLALIAADLDRLGIRYQTLIGASRNRAQLVERFQAGEAPVFLISLKAGGTGLNLTRADTVVHYDPWWNSAAEAQATDRAYRIGQDKPVFVYKLLTENTVEEKIHALQQHKRDLLQQLYNVAEANTEQLTLDNAALMALLDE